MVKILPRDGFTVWPGQKSQGWVSTFLVEISLAYSARYFKETFFVIYLLEKYLECKPAAVKHFHISPKTNHQDDFTNTVKILPRGKHGGSSQDSRGGMADITPFAPSSVHLWWYSFLHKFCCWNFDSPYLFTVPTLLKVEASPFPFLDRIKKALHAQHTHRGIIILLSKIILCLHGQWPIGLTCSLVWLGVGMVGDEADAALFVWYLVMARLRINKGGGGLRA